MRATALPSFSVQSMVNRDRQIGTPPHVHWVRSLRLDFDPVRIGIRRKLENVCACETETETVLHGSHTYQNTILQISSRAPMKHSGWIVFHFRFFKIKVFRLVISDASRHRYTVALLRTRTTTAARWPFFADAKRNNKKTGTKLNYLFKFKIQIDFNEPPLTCGS